MQRHIASIYGGRGHVKHNQMHPYGLNKWEPVF